MQVVRRSLLGGLVGASVFAAERLASAQTYSYDALGRLTKVQYADGSVVDYSYDAAGNRTQVVQAIPPPAGAFVRTIAITHTGPINLRTLANTFGYDGARNATVIFTVASTLTILGGSGGPGIDTGTWPTSTYAVDLDLQVSGKVYGGGGTGGEGAFNIGSPPSTGGVGGHAISCQAPIDIIVNAGGEVKGGGGGGGGGGGAIHNTEGTILAGGGGGGGFPSGNGGGPNGSPGTPSGGGAGGPVSGNPHGGAGGNGGGVAAAGATGANSAVAGVGWTRYNGASGGAAGYAIRKNGNIVNVTNSGTITGTVG